MLGEVGCSAGRCVGKWAGGREGDLGPNAAPGTQTWQHIPPVRLERTIIDSVDLRREVPYPLGHKAR